MNEYVTRNIAEISDVFICEKCGIYLEDCVSVEYVPTNRSENNGKN